MTRADISIHRFASVYCCAQGMDAGLRLRDRLDGVLRRSIAGQIETLCAPLLQADEDAVWLVRRLEVECAINGAWDDDQIARAWAKQVVSALGVELAAGGGERVLRFDNEAAYLAHFIVDVASGDAWSKWYYRRFAGLAALPSSGAIRSVLVQAPATGAAALRSLAVPERGRVLDALSADDVLCLLRMCADLPDTVDLVRAATVLAPHIGVASSYLPEDPRWALEKFIVSSADGEGGATLLAVIAAFAAQHLRLSPAAGTGQRMPQWVEAFNGLSALARLPRALLVPAAGLVAETPDVRHTAYGGGFVLLPLLAEWPLAQWVQDWPALDSLSAAAVLRAMLLGKCLGGRRAAQFLHDPTWLAVLGLPEQVDWHAVSRALSRLGGPARRAFRGVLSAQALALGATPACKRRVRAGRGAWQIRFDEHGYWHSLLPERGQDNRLEPDADLDYLAWPPDLPVGAAWDSVLSLAAQQLLRQFARRLPGFSLSHFDYLYRNFLAMSARVEHTGERYVVHLSRPPLTLMLNLTGMTRTEYALPWHPGCACAVFTEDR